MTTREQTSLIGIGVAIGGNVLISLALNCQKLAHKRLEDARSCTNDTTRSTFNDEDNQSIRAEEEQPLISGPSLDTLVNYGSNANAKPVVLTRTERRYIVGDRPFTSSEASHVEEHTETTRYIPSSQDHGSKSPVSVDSRPTENKETDYLRSKLWWWGFLLMNIGECGNFLSYAYAPASVVAPLGTVEKVALIANCFFAPLMLKETLRKRDILGIALAIFGAVTVVGAGKAKEVQLDVDGLIEAVSRHVFIIYVAVCLALTIGLGILSASHAGKRWVFVDIGLCAVFGGFTVLSTKALSTFISLYWIDIFKNWITYPVVILLLLTGLGQILYLNRALKNFDSKIVIPTFFISFNLSAIIGSAILYEEFQDVSIHQLTTFFYGCLTTFLGVYFLSRSNTDTASTLEETVDESRLEAADSTIRSFTPGSKLKPILQNRASLVFSASQYLLIASSPTRETESALKRNTSVNNTPVKPPQTSL